jgi:hypothetical protein
MWIHILLNDLHCKKPRIISHLIPIHTVNTRNNNQLHRPIANHSCFQKTEHNFWAILTSGSFSETVLLCVSVLPPFLSEGYIGPVGEQLGTVVTWFWTGIVNEKTECGRRNAGPKTGTGRKGVVERSRRRGSGLRTASVWILRFFRNSPSNNPRLEKQTRHWKASRSVVTFI